VKIPDVAKTRRARNLEIFRNFCRNKTADPPKIHPAKRVKADQSQLYNGSWGAARFRVRSVMTYPRVLFWPTTRELSVASYRIRCKNVVDALSNIGISVGYLSKADYHTRFCFRTAAPDVLVMSKRTKPSYLELAAAIKRRFGTKLVLDICDNLFFSKEARAITSEDAKRHRMVKALNQFDTIVTPSNFLRERMGEHLREDMKFVFISDAVEMEPKIGAVRRWRERRAFKELVQLAECQEEVGIEPGRRLVWFGNHGRESAKNGLYDIERFSDILSAHNRELSLSLTIISNNEERYKQLFADKPLRTHYCEWNYFAINHSLQLHDIAFIPVKISEFSMAKSANRLVTAFNNGLAVCASSIDSMSRSEVSLCLMIGKTVCAALWSATRSATIVFGSRAKKLADFQRRQFRINGGSFSLTYFKKLQLGTASPKCESVMVARPNTSRLTSSPIGVRNPLIAHGCRMRKRAVEV
jgi:hypothetical protein